MKLSEISFGGAKEKEYLIENLVMLCDAGMDIISALDAIESEIQIASLKKTIQQLKGRINAGEQISDALEETRLFKRHIVSLIRLGEQSGKLFKNLGIIAVQQRKERSFQGKLHSALIYPVFIFSISAIVGIAVAWFILPNLATVFSQLKLELPLITRILIAVGSFLGAYGVYAIPLMILGIGVTLYFIFIHQKTNFIGQTLLFATPGMNTMIREVELARIGYVMGSLLNAGVSIVDALQALSDTASFFRYKKWYQYLKNHVEKGYSLHQLFREYNDTRRLIPRPIQEMIVAGEKSGKLPETFLRIHEIFEERTENTSKNIAVILEPILLLSVWLAVIGVALAVILPIYNLVGGLNR